MIHYIGGSRSADLRLFSAQYGRGERIIHFIKKYNNAFSFERKLVLDVGCGTGGVLSAFRNVGARVIGLDLGADLEYGIKVHGLCLNRGTIEDYHETQEPDIIIYSHVIEHLPFPQKELKKIKEVCHAKTLIYVEVPGVLSMHKSEGDFMLYLQNAHLYHFSLKTLNNLLSQNGFSLVFGNEHVKSLFVPAPPPVLKLTNCYHENISYLKIMESKRQMNVFKLGIRHKIFRVCHRATIILTNPRKAIALFRCIINRERL
jgi:SAM-dependent methyltransferase